MKPDIEALLAWFNRAWPDDGDALACWSCPHGGTGKTCDLPAPWPCLAARKEISRILSAWPDVEKLAEAADALRREMGPEAMYQPSHSTLAEFDSALAALRAKMEKPRFPKGVHDVDEEPACLAPTDIRNGHFYSDGEGGICPAPPVAKVEIDGAAIVLEPDYKAMWEELQKQILDLLIPSNLEEVDALIFSIERKHGIEVTP